MQRRRLKACRKVGFVATPSERALIAAGILPSSAAQLGTKPQTSSQISRLPSSFKRIAWTVCVGARLYRGARSEKSLTSTSKRSFHSLKPRFCRMRPHMETALQFDAKRSLELGKTDALGYF